MCSVLDGVLHNLFGLYQPNYQLHRDAAAGDELETTDSVRFVGGAEGEFFVIG